MSTAAAATTYLLGHWGDGKAARSAKRGWARVAAVDEYGVGRPGRFVVVRARLRSQLPWSPPPCRPGE